MLLCPNVETVPDSRAASYLGSSEDEFGFELGAAGVLLVEEVPCGSGCAEDGVFPCGEDGSPDPDGTVSVPDCGVCSVLGGAGEAAGGSAGLLSAGADEVSPVVEGLVDGVTTGPCPTGAGPAAAAGEGLGCAWGVDGLELGAAGFKEADGAALAEDSCACAGNSTEFTTEGSSWSFT
jgi:hypothetical protein